MKSYLQRMMVACPLFLAFKTSAAVLYVNVNSTNPVPPCNDWSAAAADIQSAIDVSSDGDLILVTNGVYQTGQVVYGTVSNRVAVTKRITLHQK